MIDLPNRADHRPLIERFGREIAIGAPLNGMTWLGQGSGQRLVVAAGDGAVRTFDATLAVTLKAGP